MRWLLLEQRLDVNVANKAGRTALQWACKTGQHAVARYLMHDAGADVTRRMKDDSTGVCS